MYSSQIVGTEIKFSLVCRSTLKKYIYSDMVTIEENQKRKLVRLGLYENSKN